MRHVILTLDFPPQHDGGVARSMDDTARALGALGESVRVVTRGGGTEVEAHDRSYPVHVTRMWGHHWRKFHPLYLRWHLPRIAREERDAVVHFATWETAPYALKTAKRFGWKMAVHLHGREVARTSHHPGEAERLRTVLDAADWVLPVSRHVRDLAVKGGTDPAKVRVIPNSVDIRRIQGGKASSFRERHGLGTRPVILTLARLIDRKGQDTVIRALPRVLQEVPDAVYVLVGKGSYRDALETLVKETGMSGHVVFTGFLPDSEMPDAYAAADVYAMVSREGMEAGDIEGFGITYLEAAAAGVPSVAGRSGGAEDAVVEGKTGLVVDPEDVAAVGAALASLLRDRESARRMGEAGRVRAESEFSPDARARTIVRVVDGSGGRDS